MSIDVEGTDEAKTVKREWQSCCLFLLGDPSSMTMFVLRYIQPYEKLPSHPKMTQQVSPTNQLSIYPQ